MNTNNSSETNVKDDGYFSPEQISNIMSKRNNSSLMIHFNTRSLAKNKNLIEEFITEIKYSTEVIGKSETKINSKTCLNLNIPGFASFFFHNDSPTNAEGVGVYINQNLKYKK